jgi:hypothetical protein
MVFFSFALARTKKPPSPIWLFKDMFYKFDLSFLLLRTAKFVVLVF